MMKKGDKLYVNGNVMIMLHKMSYFPERYTHSKNKIRV